MIFIYFIMSLKCWKIQKKNSMVVSVEEIFYKTKQTYWSGHGVLIAKKKMILTCVFSLPIKEISTNLRKELIKCFFTAEKCALLNK